jgi:hypothetical protein
MKISVVLFISILSLFTFNSQAATCAHKCYIFGIDDQDNPVLATPDKFTALGGHSKNQNEMCVTRVSRGGDILVFTVNDIFGKELVLSIRRGSQLLASGSFAGTYGGLSFYQKKVRISCNR